MRINPFQKIYDQCNVQDSERKMRELPKLPRYLDVELTNTCNFSCFFCPTGTGQQSRASGRMSEESFSLLLDTAREMALPLRFIRWGEPMLHPCFLPWMKRVLEAGLLVHVTTNGSMLDENTAAELCDMGLQSIKISFQGVNRETYAAMRDRDFFEQLVERVATLYRIRGNRPWPYIHVSTTITLEGPEEVEGFRQRIGPFTDSHQVGRTKLEHIDPDKTRLGLEKQERLREHKRRESLVRAHAVCHQVFDVLSVNWDGSISACCGDYDNIMLVGHLAEGGIEGAWNSPRMQAYRKVLAAGGHDTLPLCKTCYDLNQLRIQNVQGINT